MHTLKRTLRKAFYGLVSLIVIAVAGTLVVAGLVTGFLVRPFADGYHSGAETSAEFLSRFHNKLKSL